MHEDGPVNGSRRPWDWLTACASLTTWLLLLLTLGILVYDLGRPAPGPFPWRLYVAWLACALALVGLAHRMRRP